MKQRTIVQLRAALTRIFVDSSWPHTVWSCHRRPERSFAIDGRQFHVCSRCTGIVCGLVAAGPMLFLDRFVVMPAAVSAALLLVDGGTQYFGLRESTNAIRVITGFAAGAFVPAALVALALHFHG